MTSLQGFAESVDWLNERIGRVVAWLTLAMILLQFVVVEQNLIPQECQIRPRRALQGNQQVLVRPSARNRAR